MAGGLGTRMRSATPSTSIRSSAGAWSTGSSRPPGRSGRPARRRRLARHGGRFDGLEVAVQERPLGTGDAVRCAAMRSPPCEEVLVLSGDTPLLTTELSAPPRPTHRANGRRGTVLSFVPDDFAQLRRIVRAGGGDLARSSRRRTRPRSSSRSARPTPRSTSSRPSPLAGVAGSRPSMRRVSSTSPTPCATRRGGHRVAVHVADASRDGRGQYARRTGGGRRGTPGPRHRRTCSPG